jgi:hypothetical protein
MQKCRHFETEASRRRSTGFIIWQVGLVMNHMMEDNHYAAKDALSLLFVCLE